MKHSIAARDDTAFQWYVPGSDYELKRLAGLNWRDFMLNTDSRINMYKQYRDEMKRLCGEDVSYPGVSTSHISYGHVNCIGSGLIFPKDGECAATPACASAAEGIALLKRCEGLDFNTRGMMPFFTDMRERMQQAFPDEPVGFGFGVEGPITSAYILRGEGFYTDIYDCPDETLEFLSLLTQSIIRYTKYLNEHIRGLPAVSPTGWGMVDDCASFIPHGLFEDFVVRFWREYYDALTVPEGRRSIHVEDLRPEQLRFLDMTGIDSYDPSISQRINPVIIKTRTAVPFSWRLGSFHLYNMSPEEIEDFICHAVADGAESVFTIIETLDRPGTGERIDVFKRQCREVKKAMESGICRSDIRHMAHNKDSRNYWQNWFGYIGGTAE